MGAALMTTHACIRAGAGLTTVNVPEDFLNVVHAYLPEAMCHVREEGLSFDRINATGIGPGLGLERDTEDLVHQTLLQFDHPSLLMQMH
jgi:NAD(P)H-hydrate epimerase